MTVLVVGAGPAGLATAVTLARYGVPTLLVDRRPQPSSLPRATGISTRTMELMRSWGLEEPVRAGGVEVRWPAWVGPSLLAPRGVELDTVWPHPDVVARRSPTRPACVPQNVLERALLDHLAELPHAEVRLGTELVALHQADGAVDATLRDTDSGALSTCRPTYVVAADGAHSLARRSVGIETDEIGDDDPRGVLGSAWRAARTTLFTVTLPAGSLLDALGERRHMIYTITDPAAGGVLLPAGADCWIYGEDCDPAAPRPTPEALAARIALAIGRPDARPTILRTGTFSFDARMARRYRAGAVFLAGDAAHRMTPRGGTGLNTAIQDGHDLGWKLAWVQLGWASPELLDSYEREREPVGRRNTTMSARSYGAHRDPVDELDVDLGGRVAHAWIERPDRHGCVTGATTARRVSTLDLVGPGLTVLTGPDAPTPPDRAVDGALGGTVTGRVPVRTCRLHARTAAAVGVPAAGSLTLRPDGKPTDYQAPVFPVLDALATTGGL